MIDFDALLGGNQAVITNPKQIFAGLAGKAADFAYLRDVQGEVLDGWFARRPEPHVALKMNVGGGKTAVGLLILQSCLAENAGPAVYVVPDNYLLNQTLAEARRLGIAATTDPDDHAFEAGQAILVVNIHKVVNGRSVFGVGAEGVKKRVGAFVIDDAHACLETVREQFKIRIPAGHPLHAPLVALFENDLRGQSDGALRRLKMGDSRSSYLTVPFWAWQAKQDQVRDLLFQFTDDDLIKFKLDLVDEVLHLCRCAVDGKSIEVAPPCIPLDVINAFAQAGRRVYMTATLPDDSVLVTDFGASSAALQGPVAPTSAADLGERMILMPQELDPEFALGDLKSMLKDLSRQHNTVVIVPSASAAQQWRDIADLVLQGADVEPGIRRLKAGHVGLVVLVNRYDGIDLPGDACRVLALVDLPEAEGLLERSEAVQQGEAGPGLRRQMQRIEQGMGRGIRSNTDYCLVVLFGTRLVRRLLSPVGKEMIGPATRAQLDLSSQLAKQIKGAGRGALGEAVNAILTRNPGWVGAHRKALSSVVSSKTLQVDPLQVALREAFDLARDGRAPDAAKVLRQAVGKEERLMLKGWLLAYAAEFTNLYDQAEAQRLLGQARRFNRQVVRPIEGVQYEPIASGGLDQAKAVREFVLQEKAGAAWLLRLRDLRERLIFEPDGDNEAFEDAIDEVGRLLGFSTQQPDREFGKGPDNLWRLDGDDFIVFECKSGARAPEIAKGDVDQLAGHMNWFRPLYGNASATPVMVHPERVLDPTASAPASMLVIDRAGLARLSEAVHAFGTALAAEEVRGDVQRIKALLTEHGFRPSAFLQRYAYSPRVKRASGG